MKVLFLSRADWAGTGFFTMSAINSIGRIQCRQLSFYPHIYDYPTDILIPKCFIPNPPEASQEMLEAAWTVIEEADYIHIWNDEVQNFGGVIGLPTQKVKSYTFSGTYYRKDHGVINKRLKKREVKRIVVQNPTYFWPDDPDEIEAEYIPHAIDLDRFDCTLPKQEGTIGCYSPAHGQTTARADIALVENLLAEKFPDWTLTCRERSIWEERLKKLAHCALYFEYMDPNLGYIGQSALEACAFGIPTMSYLSAKAYEYGGDRLGIPPIVHVTPETLEIRLRELITSPERRAGIGISSRRWIEDHFSYPVVGELYTKFFEEL